MSDTPRTDDEVEHASNVALWIGTGKHGYTEERNAMVVRVDFARTIERELAAAQQRIAELEIAFSERTFEDATKLEAAQQRITELEADISKSEDQTREALHAYKIASARAEQALARIKELDPYGRGVVKTSEEF